jgi:hypothetical protein
MAGLVPAIHVFTQAGRHEDVDARHKAGHDGSNEQYDAEKTIREAGRPPYPWPLARNTTGSVKLRPSSATNGGG